MTTNFDDMLRSALEDIEGKDTDVIAYVGSVDRAGYENLCEQLTALQRKKNCLFSLATFGGDPNAAFRIARALSHNYPDGKIRVLVPDYCKSAGTLICIGAHELVIADTGELGPLDIQVQKPDEMFKSASGLDIIRGLKYLQQSALATFAEYLVEINQGSGMSTKSASEIASKLTVGLHEPIFAQIDPMRLGEMQAALTIAIEYGTRLNEKSQNLKSDALARLASSYPSHGFVVDRKEARSLFLKVSSPDSSETVIANFVRKLFTALSKQTSQVIKLRDFLPASAGINRENPNPSGENDESPQPTRGINEESNGEDLYSEDYPQEQQSLPISSNSDSIDGCNQADCRTSKDE